MRMYDIIAKKRAARELTASEIEFFAMGAADGSIPDHQLSALLMAICINGMTPRETADLTAAMARSGDMLDLSPLGGLTADKHSTGGVGDKTTLIVAPTAAACGLKIAKMSGRGLGHTGGTIDKLESIPNLSCSMTAESFMEQVKRISLAVAGQTGSLAPADKRLYALRDVTATVDSIPLIASSIMSKKLAAGAHTIVLDVKTGSGALMKTREDARALAAAMIDIGRKNGRNVSALITDMDTPLGHAVGNALEVAEAIEVLSGGGPDDLTEVSTALVSLMLQNAKGISHEEAQNQARTAISSGAALGKLRELILAQGGADIINEPDLLPKSAYSREVRAKEAGFIYAADTEKIGIAASMLGAGRIKLDDKIAPGAGLVLRRKTGERISVGDTIATLCADDSALFDEAEQMFRSALTLSDEQPTPSRLVEVVEY